MRVVGHGDADPTAADTVLVLDDDPRFAPDVASTLDLAAGATVRRGAETTLSLRGAGGHQLRLFLDGIPLDDGRGAALDLDRLPASALASIRIRRGAAAATFGSGAQGGVVQLHTHRRPVQRLRLRLGAFGERAADAVVADRLGAADLLVALGTQTSAGDFPYVDTNGQPRTRQNNRRARLDGLARARVPLGAAGGLTALAAGQIGARGEPGHVLGLLDPDSDLARAALATGTAVVQLLEWQHRDLADEFAGVLPSPGGLFRSDPHRAEWQQTRWGPLLATASTWAGVRVRPGPEEVGWSVLVDGVVEHVEVGEADAPLVHRRGRYERPKR